jgi:hypothetical protein
VISPKLSKPDPLAGEGAVETGLSARALGEH